MNLWQKVLLVIGVLIGLFAATFAYFCPIIHSLPVPSGTYTVGTSWEHWTDTARTDTRQKSGHREVLVEFFYPSSIDSNKVPPTTYNPYTLTGISYTRALHSPLKSYGLWHNFLLNNITSYAQEGAPLAQHGAPFPIIIFLPGISGDPLYHVYLEGLASHGYFIVAITPLFDVSAAVIPNSHHIIMLDPALQRAIDTNDRAAKEAYRTKAHAEWLQDIDFVIQQLQTLPENVTSALDFNRLGIMGHSHGGWVATDFCSTHAICKAGINLDGHLKTIRLTPFKKPFLFLFQEHGLQDKALDKLVQQMAPYARAHYIPGAKHLAFSDYIQLKWPLARWLNTATGNTTVIRNMIQKEICTFFDKELKGRK